MVVFGELSGPEKPIPRTNHCANNLNLEGVQKLMVNHY